jgi:hypothetical protein
MKPSCRSGSNCEQHVHRKAITWQIALPTFFPAQSRVSQHKNGNPARFNVFALQLFSPYILDREPLVLRAVTRHEVPAQCHVSHQARSSAGEVVPLSVVAAAAAAATAAAAAVLAAGLLELTAPRDAAAERGDVDACSGRQRRHSCGS